MCSALMPRGLSVWVALAFGCRLLFSRAEPPTPALAFVMFSSAGLRREVSVCGRSLPAGYVASHARNTPPGRAAGPRGGEESPLAAVSFQATVGSLSAVVPPTRTAELAAHCPCHAELRRASSAGRSLPAVPRCSPHPGEGFSCDSCRRPKLRNSSSVSRFCCADSEWYSARNAGTSRSTSRARVCSSRA